MARPLRLEFPGALYQVTSRGNGRADIFLDDADRHAFLAVLDAVCHRLHWLCYAYCLMRNHSHLVLETPEGHLSAGMRQLHGVSTQRFHRQHDRVGHVCQGRYKAMLVDRDAYLLELARSVVLNPVRAARVDEPGAWPWSSYRETVGQAPAPSWLARTWLLGQFGRGNREACERYVQFVDDGQRHASVWQGLRQQIYLGDAPFVEHMQARLKDADTLEEIPKTQRRPTPQPLQAFAQAHAEKRVAMAAAYGSGGYTMKAIAAYFGVHYSTVSRAVRQAENDMTGTHGT